MKPLALSLKNATTIFLTLLALTASTTVWCTESKPSTYVMKQINVSNRALTDLIKAEVNTANKLKLKPYVYFYATWCAPCAAIKKYINDPRMKDAFAGTYIIAIDVDEWDSKIFTTKFDVRVMPTFFGVKPNGDPSGTKITSAVWAEDIPINMAPALKNFFTASNN